MSRLVEVDDRHVGGQLSRDAVSGARRVQEHAELGLAFHLVVAHLRGQDKNTSNSGTKPIYSNCTCECMLYSKQIINKNAVIYIG